MKTLAEMPLQFGFSFHEMQRSQMRISALLCLLAMHLTGCVEDNPINSHTDTSLRSATLEVRGERVEMAFDQWETVYHSTRLFANGEIQRDELFGTIDSDIWNRVARPHLYMGEAEPFIYTEHAWSVVQADGKVEDGYEIQRALNHSPVNKRPLTYGFPSISEQVFVDLNNTRQTNVRLLAKIRNVPNVRIPLLPPAYTLSVDDYVSQVQRVENARAEQLRLLKILSAPIEEEITALGGQLIRYFYSGSWIVFDIPTEHASKLFYRTDIHQLDSDYDPTDRNSGTMEEWRANHRVGVREYWDDGHWGQQSNPNRHSYGRLTAAVAEAQYFEDGSPCFLLDSGNNCSTGSHRIDNKYDCSSGSCSSVGGKFTSSQRAEGIVHGTQVLSIIAADYTDGQGDGKPLGDPAYNSGTGTHSTAWENDATGFAPESTTMFMGGLEGCASCYAAAYEQAYSNLADVLNMSHNYGSYCDGIKTTGIREDQLAEAFDQGVFLVASAGNDESTTECQAQLPATVPRVFAVNGLHSNQLECLGDYTECNISPNVSTRGGGNHDSPLAPSESISIVDVAAPAHITRLTTEDTSSTYGRVAETYVAGTSLAAPLVAGSALTVKDYLLDDGQLWVNSPGRLHAIMLSMADRWMDATDSRALWGTDIRSGTGRFKLRPLKRGLNEIIQRWSIQTRSFSSSSSSHSYMVWATPNALNMTHIKCTMNEAEDHRSNSDLADVVVTAVIREPVDGVCSSSGNVVSLREDSSWDLKHMITFDTPSDIAGNCLEIILTPVEIPISQTQLISTFCYGATIDDNEPFTL